MPRKRERSEHWKDAPEEHDFPAARDYLSLLVSDAEAAAIVERLRHAEPVERKAKDLLRAAGLPLLPQGDLEVAKDLRRVVKGERLSPVLLVRGQLARGVELTVADGYHRICASYHLSDDTAIRCRLVELEESDATAPRDPAEGGAEPEESTRDSVS